MAEPQGAPRTSRGVSGQEHSSAVVGKGDRGEAPTTSSARRTYTAKVVVNCSSLMIHKHSAGRGARPRPRHASEDNYWKFLGPPLIATTESSSPALAGGTRAGSCDATRGEARDGSTRGTGAAPSGTPTGATLGLALNRIAPPPSGAMRGDASDRHEGLTRDDDVSGAAPSEGATRGDALNRSAPPPSGATRGDF